MIRINRLAVRFAAVLLLLAVGPVAASVAGDEPSEGVIAPDAVLRPAPPAAVISSAADSIIASMVAGVSADSIHAFLEGLTGEVPVELETGFHTILSRYTESEGAELAAQYLGEVLGGHGYEVEMHYFNFPFTMRSILYQPGDVGLAVGGKGRVLRTTDTAAWVRVKSGLETVQTTLYDIDPAGGDRYVLVGGAGTIAVSDDAGVSWALRTSEATKRLNGVDVLAGGAGWIAGKEGVILSTTDSGETWSGQTSGTTSFLYDVAALDPLTAVVVGAGGLILKTVDGGSIWQPRASGTTESLARVAFAGASGWAVGAAGTILATTDGGETWSAQTSGTGSNLSAVSFVDAARGWAVGATSTILRTENGGATWSVQPSPFPGVTLQGVGASSIDEGWIVGLGGLLLRTTDGGGSWESRVETIQSGWANVVASRTGTTSPLEEVLLVGHYDSLSELPDPGELAPGADDNGSGIAAIVEAARNMAQVPFERTIRFVAFSGEEIDLLGSAAYAARAEARGEQITGVFNLDSVGWNDDYFRIFSNDDSGWLGSIAHAAAGTYAPGLTTFHWYCPGCTWSDHASFWSRGFDAIVGIETWEPAPPQHHTVGDTLGLVDTALVAEVTKISLATVAAVASVDTTDATSIPEWEGAGETAAGFRLGRARPNPFGSATSIRFRVPVSGPVKLEIFTVGGEVDSNAPRWSPLARNVHTGVERRGSRRPGSRDGGVFLPAGGRGVHRDAKNGPPAVSPPFPSGRPPLLSWRSPSDGRQWPTPLMGPGSKETMADALFTKDQIELRERARTLANDVMRPVAAKYDAAQEYPWEVQKAIKEAGLSGVWIPKEYGGMGAGVLDLCLVVEEFSRACGGMGVGYAVNALGSFPILVGGTDEQKERWLPPIASGEKLIAFGLSEKMAGSDAGAMSTRAERDGDSYVINGEKKWNTGGAVASFNTIFAVTEPDRGARGVSAIVVEEGTPGYRVGKHEDKMGIRCVPVVELHFENCRVPAKNLLGGQEGRGFKHAMITLDRARPGVAAQAVGLAQGALDLALEYTHERKQFGQSISSFQGVQWMFANMATRIEASRQLVHAAARTIDSGAKSITKLSAMCKLMATDVAMQVTTDCVQLFGGYGYCKDYPIEKYMRDAKITQIYEGTNQVQRLVIARNLIREAAGAAH